MTEKLEYIINTETGEKVLLSGSNSWTDVKVTIDDNLIGFIDDKKSLQNGAQFLLPNGGLLTVQMNESERVHVFYNGSNLSLNKV